MSPGRFASLDYLRGLMALAVLVFHYDKWLSGTWDANSLQGRLGVYAVSSFFVLSGLTLSLVYEKKLGLQLRSWISFYRKRIFRIFPLLWLATASSLILDDFPRSSQQIFLNFTGLFGFTDPAKDIATGAWSIGCELVFYAAFPTLLYWSKKCVSCFNILFFSLLALGIWVAFTWYSPQNMQQAQWWGAYVQVANHAFFFVAGMFLAKYRKTLWSIPKKIWYSGMAVSFLIFCFWPTGPLPYALVSGWNRIVFSVLTLIFVAGVYAAQLEFRSPWHRILGWLGLVSYSLYLLHPLVFRACQAAFRLLSLDAPYWMQAAAPFCITLVISHLSYHFFEKPLAAKA